MIQRSVGRHLRCKFLCVCASLILFLSLWAVSVFAQSPGEFVVLSWNDLGMHCANKDFSSLVVLPPYNTLIAQVVKRGTADSNPSILTRGITLTYEVPGNTYSVGKTNFWDYVKTLFGVQPPLNIGLAGNGLKGKFAVNPAKGRLEAAGIPITPFPDSNVTQEDPFQLARVTLVNRAGDILAEARPVIPVSNEINCLSCHDSEVSIITNHPRVPNLDPSKPVLCAGCHSSNALGTKGIPEAKSLSERIHAKHNSVTNNCYMCHPGPRTQCLRDVMSMNEEMTCQDCHGNLANVADSISKGRRPWLDEPNCGTCHGPKYATEPGKLYRNSKGHGGLYCSACHGSPHVIFPSREAADNEQNISLQGFAGTLQVCSVCHENVPAGEGPHGSVSGIGSAAASDAALSKGATLKGTPVGRSNSRKRSYVLGLGKFDGTVTVDGAPSQAGPTGSTVPKAPVQKTQKAFLPGAGRSGAAPAAPVKATSPAGAADAGNSSLCAQCHKDGRSGPLPPAHRPI